VSADEGRDLLEVVADRTMTRSSIVASQLSLELWHGVIGDPTLADATSGAVDETGAAGRLAPEWVVASDRTRCSPSAEYAGCHSLGWNVMAFPAEVGVRQHVRRLGCGCPILVEKP